MTPSGYKRLKLPDNAGILQEAGKKTPSFSEGIFKKRFGVKYFLSDFDVRNKLGFPDAEQGAVADVQQSFDVGTVVIFGLHAPVFFQGFQNFGKDVEEGMGQFLIGSLRVVRVLHAVFFLS